MSCGAICKLIVKLVEESYRSHSVQVLAEFHAS